jgi:hypothetical protein
VWGCKLKSELKKRGIKKVGTKLVKYKKWSTVVHIDSLGSNKENTLSTARMSHVKKEEVMEEKTERCMAVDNPTVGFPVDAMMEEPEDKHVECVDYCEYPCVWLSKKDEMIYFDQMEHKHPPEEDMPPSNI